VTDSPVAGPDLTAAALHAILKLRVDVFVVEQECPYPEVDGRDLLASTRHFWTPGFQAYLRVLAEPGGGHRIGRVVTAREARGRGLAAELMRRALRHIGDAPSVLDAQVYAQGFYARFGYRPDGEEFLEDGIPHIRMRRPAGPPR
jgi:ElaA protein